MSGLVDRLFDRLTAAVLDVGASEPKTRIQTIFKQFSEVGSNVLICLTAAFVAYAGIVYLLHFSPGVAKFAFGADFYGFPAPSNGGVAQLLIVAFVLASIAGVRLLQTIKRYQIFALIGIANVAHGFLEHARLVAVAAKTGDTTTLSKGVLALLKAFFT